jgi:hypothetical protein
MIYGNNVECDCGEEIPNGRVLLGYTTCIYCGEIEAQKVKHCIVPMNKSNYVVVTNPDVLKQLNPKRLGDM